MIQSHYMLQLILKTTENPVDQIDDKEEIAAPARGAVI